MTKVQHRFIRRTLNKITIYGRNEIVLCQSQSNGTFKFINEIQLVNVSEHPSSAVQKAGNSHCKTWMKCVCVFSVHYCFANEWKYSVYLKGIWISRLSNHSLKLDFRDFVLSVQQQCSAVHLNVICQMDLMEI